MAIKINFDTANNPELPTLILATRDGNKLGLLEAKQIELSEKLIGASEITFIVNKYVDGRLTNLWDKIVDFKLVYCQEWDVWFEIRVEIDEDTKTVKTVFCTQLGQAELSQLMLYNIEINTEADIERDDYKISVLYDEDHPEASILHRIFNKAPHYSIPKSKVDPTIASIQRSFSFDDISIYDALQEIAEEIGCLFRFHSGTDINGDIERYISVHDLEQYCENVDCKNRGEFTEVCPKCGGTNIRYGYGEDTTIFVTADELASNNIQFTTDTDSVKNCFKLEAGDDLMTATVRNCNPNGTDYIWYFSDSIKADMSEDLKAKLIGYDELYKNHQSNYEANLDPTLLSKYNTIVNKYKTYNDDLEVITSPIKGYSNLMNAYYNVIDLSLYLESGMMPNIKMEDTDATKQAALLKTSSLSPIAVANIEHASIETVNSVALGMAKILVRPTYKVEISGTSSLSDGSTEKTWKGKFTVTNYSDDEDTATTGTITITVNGKAELFIKQKIEKALNKADTEDYSIVGLFEKSLTDFTTELQKYALKPLSSFRDACQACIDILIEQGVASSNPTEKLYKDLYLSYWNKLKAIEAEMKVREDDIASIDGIYDEEGNLVKQGLATDIEKIKEQIQNELDFEKYLGEELWLEFSSYRREDKYKNENYISDGLNNAELFTRALEFIDTAENEIYKSSELQHSISSSLKNLMAINKFKPLANHFEVGNWMRVQLDDVVYRLRLLEYTIDFDSIEDISVDFSDVSKIRNGITDLEDIFSQASSMTTHYDSIKKQANKGGEAQGTIEKWLQEGLNSALVRINSNDSEEVSITQNGILCRSYDSLTGAYSPEQLKLTHNIMAYTSDDWLTVRQAIGKHQYVVYDEKADDWKPDVGYGMSAEFVTAGYLMGSTIVGGSIYSEKYHEGTVGSETDKPYGTYINLNTGAFSFGGKKLVYDADKDTLTLSGVTIQWASTNKPEVNVTEITGFQDYINKLSAIETQVDNKAETWYQDKDPSVNWYTAGVLDIRDEHVGDLWYYTGDTGKVNGVDRGKNSEWIWQKVGTTYQWCEMDVPDEVYDTIDGVASIYTSVPPKPVVGDLLIPSSDIAGTNYKKGKVYKYNGSTWEEIAYTNDDALTTFINGTYTTNLNAIQQQLDKKAVTYHQSSKPGVGWSDDEKNEHVGDLWKDSDDGKEYIYTKIQTGDTVTYDWVESVVDVPDEVFAAINEKSTIYVTRPTSLADIAKLKVGDLFIPVDNNDSSYKQGKVYRWTGTAWSEINYTDDTAVDEVKTGIGFIESTTIDGQYVISPHIVGGDLKIVDSNGNYSAEITSSGKLIAQGAELRGSLYGQLVSGTTDKYNFKVESNYVYAGWNGSQYNFVIDPNGNVTIRGSVTIDGFSGSGSGGGGGGSYELSAADRAYLESIKKSAADSATLAEGYASNAEGYAGSASGSYDEIVRLGETNGYIAYAKPKGTNSDGYTYFCVDSNGLLEARNAVIRGTVYASQGEVAGWTISDGMLSSDNNSHIFIEDTHEDNFSKWIVNNGYYDRYYNGNFVEKLAVKLAYQSHIWLTGALSSSYTVGTNITWRGNPYYYIRGSYGTNAFVENGVTLQYYSPTLLTRMKNNEEITQMSEIGGYIHMDLTATTDESGGAARKLSWGYGGGFGTIAYLMNNSSVMDLTFSYNSNDVPFNTYLSVGGHPCFRSSDALKYQVIDSGRQNFNFNGSQSVTLTITFNAEFNGTSPCIVCSISAPSNKGSLETQAVLGNCAFYTHSYDDNTNTQQVTIYNHSTYSSSTISAVLNWIAIGTPA